MSKCDIDHELISFGSKDCPLCRLRDEALDVVSQFEQLMCELEEIVRPTKKTKKKRSKKKAKKSGKLLHFPQDNYGCTCYSSGADDDCPKHRQPQPNGVA